MAGIIFANPFGSMVDGYERGQKAEIERRQYAADRVEQELTLLDKLVFEPNRELAKEQRQFAREMEMLMMRSALSRGSGRGSGRSGSGTGSEFGFTFSDPDTGVDLSASTTTGANTGGYDRDSVSMRVVQGGLSFGLPGADLSLTRKMEGW